MGAFRGAGHIRAGHMPELRAALMAGRVRRTGWKQDRHRDVWQHKATGLRFSGAIIAHYGWDAMPHLCLEIRTWRQFINDLPTTGLVTEREALLAAALQEQDDDAMRVLTQRWTLWWEETDSVMGGNENG